MDGDLDEFYHFMINSVHVDPCPNEGKKPENWPRERWIEQIDKLSEKDLKKIRKEVDKFFPNKQLNDALDKFSNSMKDRRIIRERNLTKYKPIWI